MKQLAGSIVALIVAIVLVAAMLEFALLPASPVLPERIDLPAAVATNLAQSGVEHPVTAVLLNFRGYDTLLEVAVLLLAPLVILAAGVDTPARRPEPAEPVLQALARLAVPMMGVAAVYLLWAGAYRPGGAFQAAAVFAAALLLMHLTGLLRSWKAPALPLRFALVGGLLVFVCVAAAMLLAHDALLRYPPEYAGLLILVIEASLALSLGLLLAGLFLFLSREPGGRP